MSRLMGIQDWMFCEFNESVVDDEKVSSLVTIPEF